MATSCGISVGASGYWVDAVKLLLLNDNRAHPNWGAQATPHAIDALFDQRAPDWQRTWLSWDWLRSRHRTLKSPLPRWTYEPARVSVGRRMLARISRGINPFPRVADDFDHFADEWLAGRAGPMAPHFMTELARADVLVYNGENSMYRNTFEGTRALFLLWLAKTRLDKPTCIINHTAHITGVRPMMNAMVRKVYPRLDLVTCREAASYALVRDMGIEKVHLIPDVVYWLGENADARTRVDAWLAAQGLKPSGYVCMSASGLPVSRPRGEWSGEYTALVRKVQEGSGLRAVLMARDAHCQFLEESARRSGAAYFGPSHHFTELWPLLRQASALVTGHFHYAIIASIVGCPFVPMSANNHKIAGLSEMLRWEPLEPYDVTDLSSCGDGIVERLLAMLHKRSELSALLSDRAAVLREQVGSLPGLIREAIRGGQ